MCVCVFSDLFISAFLLRLFIYYVYVWGVHTCHSERAEVKSEGNVY